MTTLVSHPAYRELRQLVADLTLISHAPAGAYGRQVPDSSESKGGKRPSGGDVDRPRRPGPNASEKDWADYRAEVDGWKVSYQRRTPDYFRQELERCTTEHDLIVLREQAKETLKAWRRTPMPRGQEPEYGSSQWKRYIAESTEDPGALATRFNCSRRYINMIRQGYRDAA